MTKTLNSYPQHVLIVEDDAFIALDIECVMESAGFEIIDTVGRVDRALDLLDQKKPDLALLDYNLGDENSVPIARKLGLMNVPFMFISGQTRETVLAEMDEEHLVVTKPFVPDHLISQAHSLIEA